MKKWIPTTAMLLLGSTCVFGGPREKTLVFLLIGQSNMAGRGPLDAAAKVPDPRVLVLTKDGAWVPAVDPLHYDKPQIDGVGLGRSFGSAIADAIPGSEICLVPAAFGGTSLDEWKKGGKLYNDAIARTKKALERGKLAGILWHQGEADCKPRLADTYADRFVTFATDLRHDLGAADVPLIVGETGRFRSEDTRINAVLATLPLRVPQCAFVSAQGLHDKGDRLHFDTPSQRIFGRRYADAWLKVAGIARPGIAAPAP